jgi:gliding motility-associated-like protein
MFLIKKVAVLILCLSAVLEGTAQMASEKGAVNGTGNWISHAENFPCNLKAFQENKGQFLNPVTTDKVEFVAYSSGAQIRFTEKGLIYSIPEPEEIDSKKSLTEEEQEEEEAAVVNTKYQQVLIDWPGSNPHPKIVPGKVTPYYFCSTDANDHSIGLDHIQGFQTLTYLDVYPGIDVEFSFHPDHGIKYTVMVKPGTDARSFTMHYSGEKRLRIDAAGNLHIQTKLGDIIDHAPLSKSATGQFISSAFLKNANGDISFNIDKAYATAGVVIDPWVVSPLTVVPNTFVPSNVGMDAANNVYIQGIDAGTKYMYVQKYTAAGALSWTYTYNQYGNTGTPWLSDLAVDPAGNTYVGQPKGNYLNTAGMYYAIVCLNTAGVLSYYYSTYNVKDIYETLNLAYSCNAQTLVEGGSGYKGATGNESYAAVMTPGTGAVGAVSISHNTGEIFAGAIAPNGNYYAIAADSNSVTSGTFSAGPYDNLMCYTVTGATVTLAWQYSLGYSFRDYTGKSGPKNLGLNGISASCAFLYTMNGTNLDQRSLATGVLIKTVVIPGGSNTTAGKVNGGLSVDLKCGYVYVGSLNNVYVYDSNLNLIYTYTGLPGIVFDVTYLNGFVAFTGATAASVGFVAQYPAQSCVSNMTHVNPTCGQSNGSATINPTFCAAPYTYLWTPSGQTGATATGLAAGTYTVQIGTGSYCVTVTDTVTLKSASGGTESIAGTNVKCAGGTDGSGTVTMAGGTAPFTYTWSPVPTAGQGTATATGLGVGTYSCAVSDAGGCTTTQTIVITAPAPLAAPNTPTNVTCNGGSNGSITVTPTGGTVAYTYAWTPIPASGTAPTAGGLTAGVYTCTVTDANGCTLPSTATITQPPAVTASATSVPALCGTSNGSATATGANGVGAYSYSWNPGGQLTQTATSLAAGNYTCTVQDANGCTTSTTISVTNTGGPSVVTGTVTNIVCFGQCNGAIPVTATGGIGPYTYSWSPAPAVGQGTATATSLCAGTYTCGVTDSQGCLTSSTGIVTQPTALASTAIATNVSCFGLTDGSITGTSTGGTTGYTYLWNPAPGSGQGTLNATALAAGAYTLTVTDANGCVVTSTATVTQPTLLTLAATPSAATCHGKCNGQVTCTPAGGTTGYAFSWNTGCLTATCANICAGNYTANVTDAHGCTATSTAIVTEPTALAMTLFPKPSHCNRPDGSDSVSVSGGTPGYTYSWSPGAITTSVDHAILSGTYTVHIKDNNGCLDSLTNIVPNLPGVLINPVSSTRDTCFGFSNGTATVAANGGFPAYSYSWTPAASIGGGQGTVTATGLAAGNYTCLVTDSAHCTNSVVMTIGQPTPVTLTPGPRPIICIGACTTLSAIGGGGSPAYAYVWSLNGTPLASSTVCPVTTTTYTANCTDSHGCVSPPQQILVVVNPPLEVAAIGASKICPGASTLLNATGTGGNGGPYTYSWIPSTGLSSANVPNPVASPMVTTTYTVIVADNCGTPTDSDMVTVTLFPAPVVNFTSKDTEKCAPVCVGFKGSSVPACASATWIFGDGHTGSGCDTVKHCYTTAGTYTVTYNVIDVDGCPGSWQVANFVNALPVPVAAFSAAPQPTTIIDPEIFFTDQSTGSILSWTWSFGDFTGASSTLQNPNYTYPDTGCFPATLTVIGTNNCPDVVEHPICIQPIFTFYAPNTFTPNNDGTNDTWSPNGIGIDPGHYHLMIFDRWGNLLWETYTWLEGWDGRANHGSNIAQIDTYVWKVDLQDVFHDKHHYVGHCNIIK